MTFKSLKDRDVKYTERNVDTNCSLDVIVFVCTQGLGYEEQRTRDIATMF